MTMIIMITITAGLSGRKIQESKLDLLKGLALYVGWSHYYNWFILVDFVWNLWVPQNECHQSNTKMV